MRVMNRNRIVLALVAACLLAGCSTSIEPTQADLKTKWESGNVAPARPRDDLIAFMRTYLNNPTNVRSAQLSQPALKRVPGDPGDRVIICVRYNARDTSGKYAGVKTGAAAFYEGKLDRFIDTPRDVRTLCGETGYEPFPDLERIK